MNIESGCIERGMKYSPIDDISGQGRTSESNVNACQKRCENTGDCSFFSFWDDGGCHLSSKAATKVDAPGVSSGPKVCPGNTFIN